MEFFLSSLFYLFFKPVVDLFSARVGQSCSTAICNFFFFIVKEDVMVFLFLLWQWNSTTVDLTLELQDQI